MRGRRGMRGPGRSRVGVGPRWWVAMVLVAAIGCGDGDSVGPPVRAELNVGPGNLALLTGDTLRVSAADGSAPVAATWSSSNPDVATVDPDGLVTAVRAGQVVITGETDDAVGEASFRVNTGSGIRVPELAPFDSIIPRLMRDWDIPGGAVAVAYNGRLLMARGYGWANQEERTVATPDHLFRIASVSKPVTAVAVLKLAEEGRLDLDDPAFQFLDDLDPPEGAEVDPRLEQVTVRDLLQHSGGWDRDTAFDPLFRPGIIADALGTDAPAGAEDVIRYMMGQPLQFSPSQAYGYSNLGYVVLGAIIQRVTGMSYADYVRQAVLEPAGADRMNPGRTLPADRAEGEASYYDPNVVPSVFNPAITVPWPDGGFYMEAMEANGAWIASAVDLVRFATVVDLFPGRDDILDDQTLRAMVARPAPPLWVGSAYYYALGWLVRPMGEDANWWHDGSLPGTTALITRAHNGLVWAAVFNARGSAAGSSFAAQLDPAIWRALDGSGPWPDHDHFQHHD